MQQRSLRLTKYVGDPMHWQPLAGRPSRSDIARAGMKATVREDVDMLQALWIARRTQSGPTESSLYGTY